MYRNNQVCAFVLCAGIVGCRLNRTRNVTSSKLVVAVSSLRYSGFDTDVIFIFLTSTKSTIDTTQQILHLLFHLGNLHFQSKIKRTVATGTGIWKHLTLESTIGSITGVTTEVSLMHQQSAVKWSIPTFDYRTVTVTCTPTIPPNTQQVV